jgi:hypothetical protein
MRDLTHESVHQSGISTSSTGTTFIDGANPRAVIVPEDNATEIFDFLPAFIKAATNK